jgi:hypothetical protein
MALSAHSGERLFKSQDEIQTGSEAGWSSPPLFARTSDKQNETIIEEAKTPIRPQP